MKECTGCFGAAVKGHDAVAVVWPEWLAGVDYEFEALEGIVRIMVLVHGMVWDGMDLDSYHDFDVGQVITPEVGAGLSVSEIIACGRHWMQAGWFGRNVRLIGSNEDMINLP